jgi:hypothetical protein
MRRFVHQVILKTLSVEPVLSCSIPHARPPATLSPHKRRIDLLYPRQGQLNLIPIGGAGISLQRISLQIHGLQIFLISELVLDLLEASEFIAASPELLQLGDFLQPGQVLYHVVANIEDAELGVIVEAADAGERVVRDVEFLEVFEVFEAFDLRETVGLDREDLEVFQGIQILS